MDLRRRTTQALAGAGALLVVAGLSLGGGVAVAEPGSSTGAPPNVLKATSSNNKSDSKSDNKKDRSSKRKSKSTGTDSTGTTDTTGSTGTTGTTAPRATTATTSTPSTTRPTPTTAPPTTPSTSAATTATTTDTSTGSDTSGSTGSSDGMTGTYNGGSYQGTQVDDDSSTTTTEPTRTPGPKSGNRPTARSGAGLPPGVYPVDSDQRTGDSTPAATGFKAPSAPAPGPPAAVAPSETQLSSSTTGTTANPGAANTAPAVSPGSNDRDANKRVEETPPPPRRGRQLGQTGDGTRRLILFGGVALLIGAVAVAFTGRDGPILAAAAALPVGPGRRGPRPRKEIDGWEDGIPLAPVKRDLARHRLGISAESYYDDEPGV